MDNLPEYVVQPLRRFLEYWEDSRRLLDVSIEGMSNLEGLVGLLALAHAVKAIVPPAIKSKNASSPEEDEANIRKAQSNAQFAKKEIEAGFPILHAHTLVGAWGALEAAIEDLLVAVLMNEPEHFEAPIFSKAKVPLADFITLEKEDRIRLLIEEISRSHVLSKKTGVDAFESLLDILLLSGPVNAEVKANIWELNHIRNVIVHRNSIADRRLVKNCPGLNLKIGDPLIITNSQLDRYGNALCEYVVAIAHRLGNRYSVDVEAMPNRFQSAKSVPSQS